MPIAPTKVIEYRDGDDPREAVMNALNSQINRFRVQSNQLLIANKPAKAMSRGGIIFTDKAKEEDTRFQSMVGLLVKAGPLAFNDKKLWPNEDVKPKAGEWVMFRAADGDRLAIDDYECRFLRDDLVLAAVDSPEGLR